MSNSEKESKVKIKSEWTIEQRNKIRKVFLKELKKIIVLKDNVQVYKGERNRNGQASKN